MTVDLNATILKPFPLLNLLETTRRVLEDLTGTRAPEVLGILGRRYERGVVVGPGAVVGPDCLVALGDFSTLSEDDSSVQHFEMELRGNADRVLAMVVDHTALGWGTDGTDVNFSPERTPIGILLAAAAALASAELGRGEFVDENIRFVDPPISSPATFIERTRLTVSTPSLDDAALAWVRQFENLHGWPPAD